MQMCKINEVQTIKEWAEMAFKQKPPCPLGSELPLSSSPPLSAVFYPSKAVADRWRGHFTLVRGRNVGLMQSGDKEKGTQNVLRYTCCNHSTVNTHFIAAFHLSISQSLDKDNQMS